MDKTAFVAIDNAVIQDPGCRGTAELYKLARQDEPLCKMTADKLLAALPGKVGITTGFPVLPTGARETDGPPGAIVLAKAVEDLGGTPILIADREWLPMYSNLAEIARLKKIGVEVNPSPIEFSCLVAVEKPGIALDGKYYNMKGEEIAGFVNGYDTLFSDAKEMGIPTIGIGDGGNELGMGNIREGVIRAIPHGKTISCVTKVTSLMVGGTSNWGAYGIAAGMSVLSKRQLLHTPEEEHKFLHTCIQHGLVDGISGKAELSVDGITVDILENKVQELREIVERSLD